MLWLASLTLCANLWSVHIDTVEQTAAFEKAVAAEFAFVHSARERTHAPLRVNNKINVGPRYLTFTALASFTAIDQPQTQRWSAADRAKLDAFDTVADAAVRDHHNEIWQLDTDFSYFAAGDPTVIVRLHTATVRSTALADYNAFGEAWHRALEQGHVPCSVAFFWTSYGVGAEHWLLQAHDPKQLDACMPDKLLTDKTVLEKMHRAEIAPSDEDGRFRADLTSEPVAARWGVVR